MVNEIMEQSLMSKWVALYSCSQDCFHIEQLYEYIEKNIKQSLNKNTVSDYRLIGIFDKGIEADNFIEQFKKQQKVF